MSERKHVVGLGQRQVSSISWLLIVGFGGDPGLCGTVFSSSKGKNSTGATKERRKESVNDCTWTRVSNFGIFAVC